jgi:hypothetical protein
MDYQVVTAICGMATPVLGTGFALYLNKFIRQQVAAKDATIQQKDAMVEFFKSAISAHQAEIAALKGERTPAIVAEHKAMLEFAERITIEKQELSKQVNSLTEEQKETQKMKAMLGLMYEIDGLSFATDIFKEVFTVPPTPKKPNVLSEGLVSLDLTQAGYRAGLSAFTSPIGDMASKLISAEKKVQHKIESNMAIVRKVLKELPPDTRLNGIPPNTM